jgi:hypothetical protein
MPPLADARSEFVRKTGLQVGTGEATGRLPSWLRRTISTCMTDDVDALALTLKAKSAKGTLARTAAVRAPGGLMTLSLPPGAFTSAPGYPDRQHDDDDPEQHVDNHHQRTGVTLRQRCATA